MKFFCEYCGCRIDPEKDTKCPNCGASYKKNATFIKQEEEKKQREQKAVEEFDQAKKTATRASKIVFIIAASIIAFTIIIMIVSMIGMGRLGRSAASSISNQINSQLDDNEGETPKADEKVTVGINEYGKTSKYQIKVTGYEVEQPKWYENLKEGYQYVTFHLMVENLTDNRILDENVNCIVDGVAQTNRHSSGYSTLPWIDANLTVTGDATFEVPVDATSYDIRYGDYVTIHIEK